MNLIPIEIIVKIPLNRIPIPLAIYWENKVYKIYKALGRQKIWLKEYNEPFYKYLCLFGKQKRYIYQRIQNGAWFLEAEPKIGSRYDFDDIDFFM